MGYKPWRVFLDTSALLAGLISPLGAAREVLNGGEAGLFEILLSSQVLLEADRNIAKKFPNLLNDYRNYLKFTAPTLTEDPTLKEVQAAMPLVGLDDAPILAAAIKSKADYLVTWNTRDFMTPKIPKEFTPKIVKPGDLIAEWTRFLRNWPE